MAADDETIAKQRRQHPVRREQSGEESREDAGDESELRVDERARRAAPRRRRGWRSSRASASFIGARVDCEAMTSATAKPDAHQPESRRGRPRPTSVKARACESGSVVIVLRYSVNLHAAK